MSRPFRFGVLAFGAPSREEWVAQARRAEELGYATFSIDEHLDRQLSPIAAMTAAAGATRTIRIGSLVFANDFRHPVLLAKEAASVDVLSGGRLELGLGTGYERADYDQTGIPFDPPGVRVSRFVEAVQVVKAAFGNGPVTYEGQHYSIRALDLLPKPIQRPHPPLLIGGGSRRILTLAAQEADIVGINVRTTPEGGFDFPSISPEATAQKVAWVREAAGARLDEIELHTLTPFVAVTERPREAAETMLRDWGIAERLDVEDLLASPHVLIGTEERIVEALLERRERYGISYVTVFIPAMEPFAPVVARLGSR